MFVFVCVHVCSSGRVCMTGATYFAVDCRLIAMPRDADIFQDFVDDEDMCDFTLMMIPIDTNALQ